MKFPLVHVKAALQNVPDFAFGLPVCAQTAYVLSKAKNGLSHEEAAAIYIYTAQCDVYRSLNAALRSQQLKRIEPWFSYLKLFQTAIEKLRSLNQVFCRGEPVDSSSSLTIGSPVTWVNSLQSNSEYQRQRISITKKNRGVDKWPEHRYLTTTVE